MSHEPAKLRFECWIDDDGHRLELFAVDKESARQAAARIWEIEAFNVFVRYAPECKDGMRVKAGW